MVPVIQKFITNSANRPQQQLEELKGIIIHWTANWHEGADAEAHYNYFQNNNAYASAHYFVDDNSIIQIIPDNEVAYHVGSRHGYKEIGNQIRENGFSPNHFLIGIEMCVNTDSNWDETYKNTIDLTTKLLETHQLTTDEVWRHYDITGKDCPRMMTLEEDEGWSRFKQHS